MRRKLSIMFAVVLGAAASAVGSTPAHAHTGACSGSWRMGTDKPFGLVQTTAAGFSMTLDSTLATCTGGTMTITGQLNGSCASATGSGMSDGHDFRIEWLGSDMVFHGLVHGTLHVAEDATVGDSCLQGNATHFVLAGTLVFDHIADI